MNKIGVKVNGNLGFNLTNASSNILASCTTPTYASTYSFDDPIDMNFSSITLNDSSYPLSKFSIFSGGEYYLEESDDQGVNWFNDSSYPISKFSIFSGEEYYLEESGDHSVNWFNE